MRRREQENGISVHAVAGDQSVILGFDVIDPKKREGLLGFAVKKHFLDNDETLWLKSRVSFADDCAHQSGLLAGTNDAPLQRFMFVDHDVAPDGHYSYWVYPVYGKPCMLTYGAPVTVHVDTERVLTGTHTIFFNRGVAASQRYAEKFFNLPLKEVGQPAFDWLSGGLLEGMKNFIRQAQDKDWGLRVAAYEFNYEPVLQELKDAKARGADVHIIYDNRKNSSGPGEENTKAINAVGIADICTPRENNPSYISHNKVIILLHKNKPVEVWTGPTNITEGGIFGHANVGHIVRDEHIAESYLQYWEELRRDPDAKSFRPWNVSHSPEPTSYDHTPSVTPVFSPRSTLDVLDLYAKEMENAKQAVFLTAAFGLNKEFESIMQEDKPYLRYVLLDKPGKGLDMLVRHHDNQIAVGAILPQNAVESWLHDKWQAERLTGLNAHVQYVHTKFMLVDPLGANPIVITGSANFSVNSTKNNDENMLYIVGDKHVADMYLCEFMRLFKHYSIRSEYALRRIDPKTGEPAELHLAPDDSWLAPYFTPGDPLCKERELFA